LTEQTKIVSREEEIKEDMGKNKSVWVFFIIGIIVSLIGYIVYDFHINYYRVTGTGRKVLFRSEYPYQFIGLVVIIIGIVIISIGIVKKVYSRI
jgi:hypothetical protein